MRTVSRLTVLPALALGLLAVSPAWAQDKDKAPGVFRQEIYNGPLRTVAYYSTNLSPGETGVLRDLELAENEVATTNQLLALRAQYIVDERALEAYRRSVQLLLYGYNTDVNTFAAAGVGRFGGFDGFGGVGFPGFSNFRRGFAFASVDADVNHSLIFGVGDEGAIKTALAPVLATSAIPDLAARANRNLDSALARAGYSEPLRVALNLPKPDPNAPRPGVALADFPDSMRLAPLGTRVIVTRLLDGKSEKLEGTVVREDADWLVIQTKTDRQTMSKKYIVGVSEPKKP
jgi:hypothetical protein